MLEKKKQIFIVFLSVIVACLFLIVGCSNQENINDASNADIPLSSDSIVENSVTSDLETDSSDNSSSTNDLNSSNIGYPFGSMPPDDAFVDVWDDMSKESDGEYTFVICNPSQGYTKWNEVIDTIIPNPDIEVLICGKMVPARFCGYARVRQYEPYITFYYNNQNLGVTADGQLKYYFWKENWDRSINPLREYISLEECIGVAENFIISHFDVDLNDYRMEIENLDSDMVYYDIVFSKYIGDFETAEKIRVGVRKDGDLIEFDSCMLGGIPNDTEINFDTEKIESIIFDQLDVRYEKQMQNYDEIHYDIDSCVVTILDTGEVALVYKIMVSGIKHRGSAVIGTSLELFSLIVK